MSVSREFDLIINAGTTSPLIINANQNDSGETWKFNLFQDDGTKVVPTAGQIVGLKSDGHAIVRAGTVNSSGQVVITETAQMTAAPGANVYEIVFDSVHGTANFILYVEKSPVDDGADFSKSDISAIQQAIAMAISAHTVAALQTGLQNETAIRAAADAALRKAIDDAAIVPAGSTVVVDDSLSIEGAAADAKVTGDAVTDLKSALAPNNSFDLIPENVNGDGNGTDKGVTYTFYGKNSCVLSNKATALSSRKILIYVSGVLPAGMEVGKSYIIKVSGCDNNAFIRFYFMNGANPISGHNYKITETTTVTVPSNANGILMRLEVANGTDFTGNPRTITYKILTTSTLQEAWGKISTNITNINSLLPLLSTAIVEKSAPESNANLNDLTGNGVYFLSTGATYTNYPYQSRYACWLIVARSGVLIQQLTIPYFFSSTAPALELKILRRNYNGSSWSDWKPFAGNGGATYNNYYEYNTNENTYTVTATPTITTDTNNYLASTGDTTDRTADIVAMLTNTGVCNLGPGDFYVKDLVMPNYSAICGSGAATKIIMSEIADGCAIQMKKYCTVQDLQIWGSASAITRPSVVGGRHGILWAGTWAQDETVANQPEEGFVKNIWIKHFTGGGITCYNTGFATYFALEVTNAYIENCGAGINISYWSEFHKFTNVRTPACLYGCINNGGNNVFVNCDFSTCTHGLLMDNSSNQSPNNSHGTMVGCVFNHTDSNTGIGIKVLNCDNGFVFDGCQIFYSQIDIEDSDGIVVSNCNFGNQNTNITVDGGGSVLFANNMHQAAPIIAITDNENVHFVNCYNRTTGALIEP